MTDARTQTPQSVIPEALRNRIGPDAPRRMRMLVARAQLPMPPSQLGVALAVLAREQDREIADAAVSLGNIGRFQHRGAKIGGLDLFLREGAF